MSILDAVKERFALALVTAKDRLERGTAQVARADLTADGVLSGLVDASRDWLAPRLHAVRERLAPTMAAARERMAPVAEAAKQRLAPVVEPLAPVFDRIREAASGFGEIAVGSAPAAEEVADPVGELRAFFDIQATAEIEPLTRGALEAGHPSEAATAIAAVVVDTPDEELEVPPYRPWALSTLEEDPDPREPVRRSRREAGARERATLV